MLSFNINDLDANIIETRNFITTREIIIDGNWLLTNMNSEVPYQKTFRE
jgi:hypothetical protein